MYVWRALSYYGNSNIVDLDIALEDVPFYCRPVQRYHSVVKADEALESFIERYPVETRDVKFILIREA